MIVEEHMLFVVGLIESCVLWSVMLQPFDSDSVEHSKHRFMVQSMLAPDDAVENLDMLVSSVTI